MAFLCVNTSLNSCSINLVSENKNIICYEDKSNPPSDIISILVKESLESASLQVSDISGIITIIGPGNYTSIRVGIAFSLGLSKSQSIPIYGISALEAIAISQRGVCNESENALVLIKALQNKDFESSTLFTINNVGIVILSALLGFFIFKESFSVQNKIGIVLAILGIALVSLA